MLMQANDPKLTKIIHVFSNGEVEVYEVVEEAESCIRDTDMVDILE